MEIPQLSNSFSTGNGGGNFERYVQTVFLLLLLIGGFSPVINKKVVQLDFQGKHRGYNTDDLIITTDGKDKPKVLCQIKHDIAASCKNSIFREVINSAWSDFQKDSFRPDIDKIALITGFIAKDTIVAFRYMYEQALAAGDSEEYFTRIKQNNFTGQKTRDKFDILVHALTIANGNIEPSKQQVWEFCKSFILLIFDLDFRSSMNEMFILSLIKCHSAKRAIDVWSGLSRYVGFCNQSAACVHLNNIPEDIKEFFNMHETFRLEGSKNVLVGLEPSELWSQLALIGGWSEDYEEDIKIIENITGLTYTDLKPLLCKFSNSSQSYISCQNGIWKVHNQIGILRVCEKYFSNQTLERVFSAASEVLVQKSNRINQNREYSFWMVDTHEFKNSVVFRNNLVEGLCILLNSKLDLSVCSDNICGYFSAKLMKNIFTGCDWVRLASLHDLLPLIAEINPEKYITELETFIEISGTEIANLFPMDDENPLLSRNYIYGIIWSVQVLAWEENHLIKCVRCLGEMSEKLTNKKHSETVINAISSILLPWHPQTMASIDKQKSAVHALLKETHECGWLVIKALLPGATTVTGETPRPKYTERDIPKELIVSDDVVNELYQYYASEAVNLANKNAVKLEELTDYIDYFDKATIETYLSEISSNADQWDDEERFPLWNKLSDLKFRILVNQKEKDFDDTTLYDILCSTIDLIAPKNKSVLYRRLYLSQYDEYILNDDDKSWAEKEQKKREVILDIYLTQGLKAVVEFSIIVQNQQDVGYKLGQSISLHDISSVLLSSVKQKIPETFLYSITSGYVNSYGIHNLSQFGLQDCNTELKLNILSNQYLSNDLLNVVAQLFPENENLFWEKIRIPFAVKSQNFNVQYVVDHLLAVGRPVAIINMYRYLRKYFPISSDNMLNILQRAATTESTERLDSYSTQMMIKSLQEQSEVDINKLSEIELLYLPYLDDFAPVQPKALWYRLANDTYFFCDLVQLGYKKRHDDKSSKAESKISSAWAKRLFQIFQNFCVVPGTDWKGVFHEDIFVDWLNKVKKWSRENDRYEVAMTIVGNGLSYAPVDNNGLLCEHIFLKTLDASDAREMRKGYCLGIINQRGAHFVDPEGTTERDLAQKYICASKCAEELGYSRYSEALKKISEIFLWEAKQNASAKYPKEGVD